MFGVSKPCCCALFSSCLKVCSTDLNSLFSEVRIHRSLITWVSGRRQERYYWKTHFFGFVGTYPTRIHLSWFKNSPFHSSKSSKTITHLQLKCHYLIFKWKWLPELPAVSSLPVRPTFPRPRPWPFSPATTSSAFRSFIRDTGFRRNPETFRKSPVTVRSFETTLTPGTHWLGLFSTLYDREIRLLFSNYYCYEFLLKWAHRCKWICICCLFIFQIFQHLRPLIVITVYVINRLIWKEVFNFSKTLALSQRSMQKPPP